MSAAPDLVALGVPLFAIAIAGESWIGRRRGRLAYHLPTALSDLACGASYVALEVVLRVATLAVYAWVYDHLRLVTWSPDSAWPWVLGLVGVDLGYYAWHRLSHVVNALWAVHVVHHHSEDYNFAVALRQPLLEPLTWMPFFAVLAIAGVPFEIYFVAFTGNLFYQFWLHTELVGRLPAPLEWVLNTPSHHRVHHGVDAAYLDRNYGGVLIVWDRLFGTFVAEGERPTYGTTTRLHSFDPLWANAAHWHHIAWLWRHGTRPGDRRRAVFGHPGWRPRGAPPPPGASRLRGQPKFRPPLSPRDRRAVVTGIGWGLALLAGLVGSADTLPTATAFVVASLSIVGWVSLTARARGFPWAMRLELARVLGLGAGAACLAAAWLSLPAGLAIGLGTAIVAAATAMPLAAR